MSDAPYEKAIEEGAKVTGKALDLVKDSAQPIADIYGLLIGDHIEAARHRRLDAITRKTKKILRDRNLAETAEVAEQIAIPLLEAAKGESREELQDLWARLLANAMDPSRRDDVRTEFVDTLKVMHPIDAAILEFLALKRERTWVLLDAIVATLKLRKSAANVSLARLVLLGCANKSNIEYALSDYGAEFLGACRS